MKKFRFKAFLYTCVVCTLLFSCNQIAHQDTELITNNEEKNEKEGYDGPRERDLLEIEKTKDPATGIVPYEKLLDAMFETEIRKNTDQARTLGFNWIERGPIYDSLGPSNGNLRGGAGNPAGVYTSGRIRAVLIDPTDPTGNTVFTAGVGGGLWKTTNLLSTVPTWQNVNDFFDNMAISTICIDPSNTNIMYFATGEPTNNSDAILGMGIWKSVNHGASWTLLPSTTGFTRTFKLLCDNSGNVYAALRGGGLRRSNDFGNSWTIISPSTTNSGVDIELSSTGTLHLSQGYFTSAGTAQYYYTTSPSTVTSGTWSSATGLPASANRLEIATLGNIVYICTTSSGNNVNNTYKSIDGGATFTLQNTTTYTTAISNTQGWYNISLDINPENASQFIVGGLDAYKSIDDGATVTRLTRWVSSAPYVHADHHFVKWWTVGAESRILMATDGGLFLSQDGGLTFTDKNRNLGLKQFYSCAIHPTLPDYFLGGAQDNGSHQLNNPGLTYSFEVTGGDGAYVDIDQNEPQFQFTSYVYNQIRRSTNGGANWSSFNFSGINGPGLFINPFDYDDVNNKLFSSYGSPMLRWNNPTTAINLANSDTNQIPIPGASGSLTAFTSSPNVNKRLYVGTSSGNLLRIENSNTVTYADIADNTTTITGPSFAGYLNCIAVGSNDQNLLAIFTNYNVTNVWQTSDGGASWNAIDGNLPNMPVRWAVYDPTNDDKIILATEAGVYVTLDVNGGATQWTPSADFPTVRTDMLKVRQSDKLILAATHGRGLWSSFTNIVLPVKNIKLDASLDAKGYSNLSWKSAGAENTTKFNIQYSMNGISFTDIASVSGNASAFKHLLSAPIGYYRIMSVEQTTTPVYSNVVAVKSSNPIAGLQLSISPNPVSSSANFIFNTTKAGIYKWIIFDMQGKMIQSGNGILNNGSSLRLPVNTALLGRGTYTVQVIQNKESAYAVFIKQ